MANCVDMTIENAHDLCSKAFNVCQCMFLFIFRSFCVCFRYGQFMVSSLTLLKCFNPRIQLK